MNGEAGKGSAIRQTTNWKKFESNYDLIFKKKDTTTTQKHEPSKQKEKTVVYGLP